MGALNMKTKNADLILANDKLKNAWNEMSDLVGCYTNQDSTVWNYLNFHDYDAKMNIKALRRSAKVIF